MMIIACRQFMRKYWEIVEYMQMLNSIYIFMFNELMTRRQLFSSKLDLQAPIQVIDLWAKPASTYSSHPSSKL